MKELSGPVIAMHGIGKSFSGVQVLNQVNFHIEPGEVVALLGANGAGKSTLMKILTGNYVGEAGHIDVAGEPADIDTPATALQLGIRLLPQELSVFADLSVAENIMLGNLPRRMLLGIDTVDQKAMQASAATLLARLGLAHLGVQQRMGNLSHHEQRIVEIARALAGNARVLIMDEPSAALADTEVQVLFAIISKLRQEGVALVYISHYLNEVFAVSDRIVVLRDGRNAGDFKTDTTDEAAVLEAIVGNRVGNIYPEFAAPVSAPQTRARIEGLNVRGKLHHVSLDLYAGQILGVHGLIGSGLEQVGRALFGAIPGASAEQFDIDGKPCRINNPGEAVAVGIGLVAAERKREGIIPMLSLRENLSVPNLSVLKKGWRVDRHRERQVVNDWIDRLSIRTRSAEQPIGTLSGGNQQKVCLARWLVGNLSLLILEEPTRGVDMGARQEIYRQIRDLADTGLALLLVSSDAEEVAGLSDRSVVLGEGHVVARFDAPATATELMAAASLAVAA